MAVMAKPTTAVSSPPEMYAQLEFASLSCSRYTDSFSALISHPLAAYISHNNAVILSTLSTSVCVKSIIPIRRSPLNAIQLINFKSSPILLTASADGYISICTSQLDDSFRLTESFQIHRDEPCLSFDIIPFPGENKIFIASVSNNLLITSIVSVDESSSTFEITSSSKHEFQLHSFIPQKVALHFYAQDKIFIAIGGTDKRIHIFKSNVSTSSIESILRIPAHRDWVRSLAWTNYSEDTQSKKKYPLLASASSDNSIKLWKIAPMNPDEPPQPLHLQFDGDWAVKLIALFDEHEKAVQCVKFSKDESLLLSTSMDGTIAVWNMSTLSISARFGLLGGHSIHATGFFSADFVYEKLNNDHVTSVMAAGFSGALHKWRCEKVNVDDDIQNIGFIALPAVGGHVAAVKQVVWAPDGSFMLSVSEDKSVRAFVELDQSQNDEKARIIEWARPQVHGHAMFSVAFCNVDGSRYISAGEERMLRVFDATDDFKARRKNSSMTGVTKAKLPELGLSNKAVFATTESHLNSTSDDEEGDEHYENGNGSGKKIDEMKVISRGSEKANTIIPLEEELKQDTLWPETAKLYGHANEIVRVAADATNGIIASACRANRKQDAEIILWDGSTGVEIQRLSAHESTITDMKFSNNGNRLVTVSKDRSVAVFQKDLKDGNRTWNMLGRVEAAHTRIAYCCVFMGDVIVTGGRDKWIRMFEVQRQNEDQPTSLKEIGKLKMETAVTAIDSVKWEEESNDYMIAIGLDSGDFCVMNASVINSCEEGKMNTKVEIREVFRAGEERRCGEKVTCVQWRPTTACNSDKNKNKLLYLAISSEDMSVRLFSMGFKK